MICPKCGFEQPENPDCMRCGIVVSRYKGPVLGGAPALATPPPLTSLPPPPLPVAPALPLSESAGTVFGGPPPAAAMAVEGGGTLYEGPMPAAAGGGTVYGGTIYGGPGSAPVATGRVQGEFGVGKILSEMFSVYFSNLIPFALLTAIALSPVYLLQAYSVASSADPQKALLLQGVATLLSVLCQQVATASITFGVFQQMRGRDASIGDCLGRGFGAMGSVLLLAIVQGIGIWFGFIACIVPGILLALRWAVSVPAAVEERPGVFGALERSTYLMEGYRGEIFGIYFVLGILIIGSVLVVTLATGENQALQLTLMGIVNLVITGLTATVASVMYYRLRSIKESIDVDQISSVFA